MRIEAPKIEVSNLEGAIQGSKVIQIIWFNILWCILLGPQLSPVSSVLLLDIIFIDWIKVKYFNSQSRRSIDGTLETRLKMDDPGSNFSSMGRPLSKDLYFESSRPSIFKI